MTESLQVSFGFGAIEPLQGQPLGKLPGLLLGHVLLILAISLGLLLLLLFWAKYLRNLKFKKKRSEGERVVRRSPSPHAQEESEEASEERKRRYKYRWRRRKHRVRNPTLAETGGLPHIPPQEGTGSS